MVLTALPEAVKPAVVEPAGTVTEAGTETALLLLVMAITVPPVGAAAVKITEQLEFAGVTIVFGEQVS